MASANPGNLTKTVLFSGGMQDDVSTYHQAEPGCNYIQNGRFRKKDEIEKRLPYRKLSKTGLPVGYVTDGNPLALAELDDTLVTIKKDGTIYTYDASDGTDTWNSKSTNIIPYKAEVAYQTAPESGAHVFQSIEGPDYKAQAWEIRKPGSIRGNLTVQTDVICEVRRLNGDLTERYLGPGARHPVLRNSEMDGTGNSYLIYQADTGQMRRRSISSSGVGSLISSGQNAILDHPLPDQLESFYDPDTGAIGAFLREDGRAGFCDDGDKDGFFNWNVSGSGGAYYWHDGTNCSPRYATPSIVTGTIKTIASNSDYYTFWPLAVHMRYNDAAARYEAGTLTARVTNPTGIGDVLFHQYYWNTVSSSWTTIEFGVTLVLAGYGGNQRPINGDIYWDESNDTWRFACTSIGFEPDWINADNVPAGSDRPIVLAGHIDTSANNFSIGAQLRDHRLVSRVTPSTVTPVSGEVSGTCFAVEQWAPFAQPRSNIPQDEFASCPVIIRPHTTVVIELPYNTQDYQVIATLGAGQNKGCNGSAAELTNQLQSAYTRGNDVYITTRNVLQPEDISIHLGNSNATRKRYNVLFPGEASGKVVKLTKATTLTTRRFGDATLFGLAVPSQYDGVAFGEQSVFDQPEIATIQTSATGYEDIAYEKLTEGDVDNWYRFTVVVGFADHLGNLHRSAPSTPMWVNGIDLASVADTDNQVELGVTMPLSAYGTQRRYFVEAYAAIGEAAGQLAGVKSFDVDSGDENTEDVFSNLVYNNNGQQDPIRWSETLYTEGNVLPSDPWPAFDDFVITSNRLFAISSEVPGTVYYSKLLEENIAPEFSAALVISLGRNRKLTGIGAIDDKVIIFTEREIFAVYDTGPDNTGANGDFVIDRLQTTVGCSDSQSVVEIPDGLFFFSTVSNEFHLLSRDLQVHDIGKPVEDTASAITEIYSALVFPGEHEVRWYVESDYQEEYNKRDYLDDPFYANPPNPAIHRDVEPLPAYPALAYKYHYKKWMVHSNSGARHSVLFQNQATYISATWNVYQSDAALDAWPLESSNKLVVRTPWIRVNQLQSFGRIERLTFLGKYLSCWRDEGGLGTQAGDINIRLRYDYEDNDDNNEYDDYRIRANDGSLGGKKTGYTVNRPNGRMQFDITPGRQKCQAIQVEMYESGTNAIAPHEGDYSIGRGYVIAGMDIEYTPMKGTGANTTHRGSSK